MIRIWYKRRFRVTEPDPELSLYLKHGENNSLWQASAEYQKLCKAYFKNTYMTTESFAALQKTAWYNDELKKWVTKHRKETLAEMWHWETEVRNKVSVRIMEFESAEAYKAYIEVYGGIPECLTLDGEVTMIVSRVKQDR